MRGERWLCTHRCVFVALDLGGESVNSTGWLWLLVILILGGAGTLAFFRADSRSGASSLRKAK